jgi:hypothetical protein
LKKRKEIAIRFELNAIHLLSYTRSKTRLKICDYAWYQAPSTIISDDYIHLEWAVRKIEEFIGDVKEKSLTFHLSLPYQPEAFITKVLETKNVGQKDLKKYMPFLLEDELNIKLDLYDYRWKMQKPRHGQDRVMVSLLKKSILKEIMFVFEERNWGIETIETDVLSNIRVLQVLKTSAVIDVRQNETNIITYKEDELVKIETIVHSDGYPLFYDEKELDGSNQSASTTMDNYMENLKQALIHLRFSDQLLIESLYLMGVEENEYQLRKTFEAWLGQQVLDFEIPEYVRTLPGKPIRSTSIPLLGLALKDPADSLQKLNFMGSKWVSKKSISTYSNLLFLSSLTILLSSQLMTDLANSSSGAIKEELKMLQSNIVEYEQKISNEQLEVDKYSVIMQEMNQLQQQLNDFRLKEKVNYPISNLLRELADSTTSNTVIDAVTISAHEKAIAIVAHSYSYKEIGYFLIAIESIGNPTLTRLDKSNDGVNEVYEFEIKLSQISFELGEE